MLEGSANPPLTLHRKYEGQKISKLWKSRLGNHQTVKAQGTLESDDNTQNLSQVLNKRFFLPTVKAKLPLISVTG